MFSFKMSQDTTLKLCTDMIAKIIEKPRLLTTRALALKLCTDMIAKIIDESQPYDN